MFAFTLIALFAFGQKSSSDVSHGRQVAITIDDLPYVGAKQDYKTILNNTRALLQPLRQAGIPTVDFVVGNGTNHFTLEQKRELYGCWIESGAELGNHTWTHADFDTTSNLEFEYEILETDAELKEIFPGKRPRYFRAPYLNNGKNAPKKAELNDFLRQNHWIEAPATFDSDEYYFATVFDKAMNARDLTVANRIAQIYVPYWKSLVEHFEGISMKVFGRECAQILLIHSNRLNARVMPQLIKIFRDKHYAFVSLEQAMRDKAYRTPNTYVGSGGLSWLYRWSIAKKVPVTGEASVPQWVKDRFRK